MVEVFQTNIQNPDVANRLLELLQTVFPEYRMNFDLEDCDNIFRVESIQTHIDAGPIMEMVKSHGHYIAVLPDVVPMEDRFVPLRKKNRFS